jgi:hypothetical protein
MTLTRWTQQPTKLSRRAAVTRARQCYARGKFESVPRDRKDWYD